MRKLRFSLKFCLIALFLVTINMESITTGHQGFLTTGQFFNNGKKFQTPMHKVQMTQRGYIQFLRWGISVPEISEFTFCLWMQSTNMTFAQSFFSYSRNEKERQIRSWISAGGRTISLEINNVEIFTLPFSMEENRWYHLCQSWQNKDGRYGMWIDGTLKTEGYTREMMGYVIPSKGDIVLGQEFTDFDKGLEEGIEGSVLGFNFLLSTAFHTEETSPVTDAPLLNIFPTSHGLIDNNHYYGLLNRDDFNSINRRSIYQQNPFVFYKTNIQDEQSGRIVFKEGEIKSNLENERTMFQVPLGLQLVMISHSHCEIGRGSPFIGGQLMLISWTRTPVRVFGGAIVKPVKSVCGYFY